MTKVTAKECYINKADGSSDLTLTFILADNQELRLQVSRDLAHDMQLKIFQALDTLGVYRPKDVH